MDKLDMLMWFGFIALVVGIICILMGLGFLFGIPGVLIGLGCACVICALMLLGGM